MANEKINTQEIFVDKNELSDQDLEQATGGVSAAAAVVNQKHSKTTHDGSHH